MVGAVLLILVTFLLIDVGIYHCCKCSEKKEREITIPESEPEAPRESDELFNINSDVDSARSQP